MKWFIIFVSLKGCSSPQISEEEFLFGIYDDKIEIDPRFVGVIKEFDVLNVNSISELDAILNWHGFWIRFNIFYQHRVEFSLSTSTPITATVSWWFSLLKSFKTTSIEKRRVEWH